MPSLRNHTHCQVAKKSQHTVQNLSKSMAAQTHGLTEVIKHENTTHNIKQLGFRGLRAFVFQTNFSNGGYERAPKTQPFHIVKRYRLLRNSTNY
jgi:hypothetical protein